MTDKLEVATQTDGPIFNKDRKFNTEIYTDRKLKALLDEYNHWLAIVLQPLEMPQNAAECEAQRQLIIQKEEALAHQMRLIKENRPLLLACQEKEIRLEAVQADKAHFIHDQAKLAELKNQSFLRLWMNSGNRVSKAGFVASGIFFVIGGIGLLFALGLMPWTLPVPFALAIWGVVTFGVSALLSLSAGLVTKYEIATNQQSKYQVDFETNELQLSKIVKTEELLLSELQRETIDMVDQVEMTSSSVNEVSESKVRNAFFQVNPSMVETVNEEVLVNKPFKVIA
jgi:hypothetical protein